ncbi:MAG TPA: nucleoside/nucleotide kinase family protein [Devosia sp.]|nr:nucleoside/nucleotide kinase family protein [Devosia sp.]
MVRNITVGELADALVEMGARGRIIAGIAGPPGVGKSTLCAQLSELINQRLPSGSVILPMDGFHYDDRVLSQLGLLHRKGAPETFDAGGFLATLKRVREQREESVAVPVFDRKLELSRAGGRLIRRHTPIVLVEGNYVLLDADPWRHTGPLLDVGVMLRAEEAELERRLRARWAGLGVGVAETEQRIRNNDMVNGSLVLQHSRQPDYMLDTGAD